MILFKLDNTYPKFDIKFLEKDGSRDLKGPDRLKCVGKTKLI